MGEQRVMSLDKDTLHLAIFKTFEHSKEKDLIKEVVDELVEMDASAKQKELESVLSKYTKKANVADINKTVLKIYAPYQRAYDKAIHPSFKVEAAFAKTLTEIIDYGSKFMEVNNVDAAAYVFTAFAEAASSIDLEYMESIQSTLYDIDLFTDKVNELMEHDDFDDRGDIADALRVPLAKFQALAAEYR